MQNPPSAPNPPSIVTPVPSPAGPIPPPLVWSPIIAPPAVPTLPLPLPPTTGLTCPPGFGSLPLAPGAKGACNGDSYIAGPGYNCPGQTCVANGLGSDLM